MTTAEGDTNQWQALILQAFKYVAPVALFFQIIALQRWAVDLPQVDDWRVLVLQEAGSLNIADLFRPANDTLYPAGKFLDSLAVRYLGYNTVLYQSLSMVLCLGGILLLQFILIRRLVSNAWQAVPAYMACLFMLQPSSYWGGTSLAYHQAMPLLLLLFGIYLTLAVRVKSVVAGCILSFSVATIAALGGLFYISGAFAAAAAALVSLFFAFVSRDMGQKRNYYYSFVGYLAATIFTLPAQLWVILVLQGGSTHRPDAGWSFPWEVEFWSFILGMVAKAVGLHSFRDLPVLIAGVASCLAALFLAIAYLSVKGAIQNARINRAHYVYLMLFAVVGSYCILVAASRSKLGLKLDYGALGGFYLGIGRFHYFWITLLLPWVVLIAQDNVVRIFKFREPQRFSSCVTAMIILSYCVSSGILSYNEAYQDFNTIRSSPARECIQSQIIWDRQIKCSPFVRAADAATIQLARQLGYSFTKSMYFPEQEFTMALARTYRAKNVMYDNQRLELDGEQDPQVLFNLQTARTDGLAKCRQLILTGSIHAEKQDTLQFFILRTGIQKFSKQDSKSLGYADGGLNNLGISIDSPTGFAPTIRLDPGKKSQHYVLENLRLSCSQVIPHSVPQNGNISFQNLISH